MEVARPPILLALLATLVLALIPHERPARKASVVLRSETGLHNFGIAIAADGPRLAMVDRAANGHLVVRIERFEHGVTAEARLDIGDAWKMPSIALRGDTLVVHTDANELLVFVRVRQRWVRTQSQQLPAECVDAFLDGAHLGDRVLVIESRNVFCVLEPLSAGTWGPAAKLERRPGDMVRVSRARIIVAGFAGAAQLERTSAGWTKTATFRVPDASVFGVATNDRWLVLRDNDRRLHVFDLDAGTKSAVLTPSEGHEISSVAVGATTIVAADNTWGLEWRFSGTWGEQELIDAVISRSGIHRIAIGDKIWIGVPELMDGPPGRIHGYELR